MNKLSKFSSQELQEELDHRLEEPKNPVDFWKVSTSGDEEGKTTKNLGIHHGHWAETAMKFSGVACYSLYLDRVEEPLPVHLPTPRTEVSINYRGILPGLGSSYNDKACAIKAIQKMLEGEYEVTPSNYYMSVKIRRKA